MPSDKAMNAARQCVGTQPNALIVAFAECFDTFAEQAAATERARIIAALRELEVRHECIPTAVLNATEHGLQKTIAALADWLENQHAKAT